MSGWGWWDRSFQPLGLDWWDMVKTAHLEPGLAGSGAWCGLVGSGSSTGSELGGGFGGPSLPQYVRGEDDLITSPTLVLPPSWILELISLSLSTLTA